LQLGTDILIGVLGLPWSVDGAPGVIYHACVDDRHANNLELAGIIPDVTGSLLVQLADYTAAGLAVGRRITVHEPVNREFLIAAEDIQPFRVLLTLQSPDQ
jgi:hypothetical protein